MSIVGSTAVKIAQGASRRHPSALPKIQRRSFWMIQRNVFRRWQDLEGERKTHENIKHRVKNFLKLSEDMYISPEQTSDVMPKKDPADMNRHEQGMFPISYFQGTVQMKYLDWSLDNLRRCKDYRHFQHLQYDQRFLPERLMFLGPDLAAAHFIVHRWGSVKFIGDDTWYQRDKKSGRYENLPTRKTTGLYLEAIDASGTELMYEGFDNLYDLESLRMLNLANTSRTDDWVLSRVGGMFSSLEMLNLSHCKRISAKGLLGLRSLKYLRHLHLEGLDEVKDIAKSALLLEEAIPNLTVTGLDFEVALEKLGEERKLLQNDRVLIDARGNAFVEDDNGRLFYVHGNVSERPAVCSDDKPLMTSTIRREIPAMSDATFEELDELSRGKLRHLLVGSPSGYSWTEQVETILSFEQRMKDWEHTAVDPKMLPKDKRVPMLEYKEPSRLGKFVQEDRDKSAQEMKKIENV